MNKDYIRLTIYEYSDDGTIASALNYDLSQVQNVSIPIADRPNNDDIHFGIISSTSRISLIDSNFLYRVQEGKIKKGAKVSIGWAKNVATTFELFIKDFEYDSETKEATLLLTDNLEIMQDISVSEITLERDEKGNLVEKTAYDLFLKLRELTIPYFSIPSPEDLPYTRFPVEEMKKIKISAFYYEASSLWNLWTKFCELVQGHLFYDSRRHYLDMSLNIKSTTHHKGYVIVRPNQIYEMTPSKTFKSGIDKIEFTNTDLEFYQSLNVLVETKEIELDGIYGCAYSVDTDTKYIGAASFTCGELTTYYAEIKISIDKYSGLGEWIAVYDGVDENGIPRIATQVKFKHSEGYARFQNADENGIVITYGATPFPEWKEYTDENHPLLEYDSNTNEEPIYTSHDWWDIQTSIIDISTDKTAKFVYNQETKKFDITLLIKVGSVFIVGKGEYDTPTYYWQNDYAGLKSPYFIKQIPTHLQISLYGTRGDYKKIEVPFSLGNGHNVISLPKNEFISSHNYITTERNLYSELSNIDDGQLYICKYVFELESFHFERKPTIEPVMIESYVDGKPTCSYAYPPELEKVIYFIVKKGNHYEVTLTLKKSYLTTECLKGATQILIGFKANTNINIGAYNAMQTLETFKEGKTKEEFLCSLTENYYAFTDEIAYRNFEPFSVSDPMGVYNTEQGGVVGRLVTSVECIYDGALWQKLITLK